jgi:hypothetical protein
MSLSDEIEVRIAGNLCQEVTLGMRDGTTLATTIIAASPTALVDGRLDGAPVRLALEVRGTANAVAFAARAGIGSRVILRGRLEQRETTRVVELPRADGGETVAVRLSRQELVVVVERLLYVAPPSANHLPEG